MISDAGTLADSATTWIALLRAVNVGRANRIAMPALHKSLEALGYGAIRTYLQSGNAVFTAPSASSETLGAEIAARLAADNGIDVGVVVASAEELAAIVRANPLLAEPSIDRAALHVIVLGCAPDRARFDALELPCRPGEVAVLLGRAIYLALPWGAGNTKLTNARFERALGCVATARNWRTATALLAMVTEGEPGGGALHAPSEPHSS